MLLPLPVRPYSDYPIWMEMRQAFHRPRAEGEQLALESGASECVDLWKEKLLPTPFRPEPNLQPTILHTSNHCRPPRRCRLRGVAVPSSPRVKHMGSFRKYLPSVRTVDNELGNVWRHLYTPRIHPCLPSDVSKQPRSMRHVIPSRRAR